MHITLPDLPKLDRFKDDSIPEGKTEIETELAELQRLSRTYRAASEILADKINPTSALHRRIALLSVELAAMKRKEILNAMQSAL